ncbi:MAG: pilus assembly protein PilP [Chromatiales bacterium]|nr:pilus assembly protein PilP [Chromatiales bacterium]
MVMGSSARTLSGLLLAAVVVTGCGGGQSDLEEYIDKVKARPGGRIDPLPQVKPYETFAYEADNLRSPFVPDRPTSRAGASGPRPEASRPKEYLEQFPIDSLAMAGTISQGNSTYGLVQTRDGLLHKVKPGNYIGQYDGRVVAVTPAEIRIEELVPDGIGGFYKRSAAIALNN